MIVQAAAATAPAMAGAGAAATAAVNIGPDAVMAGSSHTVKLFTKLVQTQKQLDDMQPAIDVAVAAAFEKYPIPGPIKTP